MIDKTALLAAKVKAQTYEIQGVGEVSYRGLTRAEAVAFQGKEFTPAEMDVKLLALCVTEPDLSEEDWKEIQDTVPAGLLEGLSEAIAEASGMKIAQAKETYARFHK